jgi:hypothetical protein
MGLPTFYGQNQVLLMSLGTITNNTPPISPSPAALALRIANSTAKETGYESNLYS